MSTRCVQGLHITLSPGNTRQISPICTTEHRYCISKPLKSSPPIRCLSLLHPAKSRSRVLFNNGNMAVTPITESPASLRRVAYSQDAHELLLDLLNDCSELLEAEQKSRAGTPGATPSAAGVPRTVDGAAPRKGEAPPSGVPMPSMRTWVHDMFQARPKPCCLNPRDCPCVDYIPHLC